MTKTKTKVKREMPKIRKTPLANFLSGVHNIGPLHRSEAMGVGRSYEKGLVRSIRKLAKLANKSDEHFRGAREAARLFLEITAVDNPEEYMAKEALHGFEGQRVGSDGATIVITATSLSSVKVARS